MQKEIVTIKRDSITKALYEAENHIIKKLHGKRHTDYGIVVSELCPRLVVWYIDKDGNSDHIMWVLKA